MDPGGYFFAEGGSLHRFAPGRLSFDARTETVFTMLTHSQKLSLLFSALVASLFLLTGAGGCSSDPNVEGAKLDLRNKDYDRALNNLNVALETNPDNVAALKLKGTVLVEKAGTTPDPTEHSALIAEATETWNRAMELATSAGDRNDIIQQQKLAWYREYERGMAAFSRGSNDRAQYDIAAQYFRNATSLQPDSAVTHINLAYALISSGKSSEAIPALEAAVETGDNNPDTYNYLTELYIAEGNMEKGIAFAESAVERFPEDENLRARLFNAYIQSGQIDRGVNLAQRSVASDPNNAVFRYNYGSLLLQAERFDEAIAELTKATELDPESSNALYNLGAAYENWAVLLNNKIADLEDQIRAEGLSDAEKEDLQKQIDGYAEERHQMFEKSLPPLLKARALVEERGEDPTDICNALFQAYAQDNQMDKAEEAATCAGIDLGNN